MDYIILLCTITSPLSCEPFLLLHLTDFVSWSRKKSFDKNFSAEAQEASLPWQALRSCPTRSRERNSESLSKHTTVPYVLQQMHAYCLAADIELSLGRITLMAADTILCIKLKIRSCVINEKITTILIFNLFGKVCVNVREMSTNTQTWLWQENRYCFLVWAANILYSMTN